MSGRSLILFLPDDTQKTGASKPLFLQTVSGQPLLKWLAFSLGAKEVSRVFLACKEPLCEQAAACFPKSIEVMTAQDENPADLLHVFLSTAEEDEEEVLTVLGPVVYAPALASVDPGKRPVGANACTVSRERLMEALDEDRSLTQFFRDSGTLCTDRSGFFSVRGLDDLAHWQPLLMRQRLLELVQSGVEVWDYATTFVSLEAKIGLGTVLLPGTVIEGNTTVGYGSTIGPHTQLSNCRIGNHTKINASRADAATVGNECEVGPYANLRPGTTLGNHCKAGAFVELKNTTVGDAAQVPHLSYLGDAQVGSGVNIGCGTVTANYDRVAKYPTKIENDAFIGCNTSLVAPVTVGEGAYVAAGSVITEDVPAQALGIGRSRQSNRREWALKNKQTEDTP